MRARRCRCRGSRAADDGRRVTTCCSELAPVAALARCARRSRRRAGAGRDVAAVAAAPRRGPRDAADSRRRSPARAATRIAALELATDLRPTSTPAPPAACAARRQQLGARRRRRRGRVAVRRRGAGGRGGRAGRALRRPGGPAARQHAGGARDSRAARDVYIANVLKCRPPEQPHAGAAPRSTACRPYLDRQIALIAPEADRRAGQERGEHAARRPTRRSRSLRGRVHRYRGVPLVVTYHPAYLLRNLPDKAKAWDDLLLARADASRPAAGAG